MIENNIQSTEIVLHVNQLHDMPKEDFKNIADLGA